MRPAYLNLRKFPAMAGNCRAYLDLSGFYQGCRDYINLPRLNKPLEIPQTFADLQNVLRSVKDTRNDKPGNLFYVPGEMLKETVALETYCSVSKRTEDILIKVVLISRKVGGFRRI
jgi:hypothetical protein